MRALIERGHQVTMVCGQGRHNGLALEWDARRGWHRGVVDGIDVIGLPLSYSNHDGIARRAWIFLRFAWRSIGIALRHDYDVLFATSTPLTAAVPGIAMKMAGRRKPFVFEVRDLWPELPRALGMKNPLLLGGMSILEKLAYRMADRCVGLSPGIVEGIRRRAPARLEVDMIPNGCDLGLFTPNNRERSKLAGVEAGDFVAGFTGTHGVANGLDAVLDAAAELKRCGRRDIKLVLIGDGGQKERLVARAKRDELDNCLFLSSVKKTAIAPITASLDCGMQILANVPAFYFGTSPNKFFDYIAAGVPVLCNYPGWLAEMIVSHRCGVAVTPDDPAAFATALCRLADNRDEAAAMGRNGRALAESQFSREMLAKRFVNAIECSPSSGDR
jgi:glycosyltransferase involved in cell wall biosynthesis